MNYFALYLGSNIISKLIAESYSLASKISSKDSRVKVTSINHFINKAFSGCSSSEPNNEGDGEIDEEITSECSYEIKIENNKPADFKVSNARMRKVAVCYEELIDVCFKDINPAIRVSDMSMDGRKQDYMDLFRLFIETAAMLRIDDDFSDHEINEIQLSMDKFFRLYINMFGRTSITNYIHLWGSGDLRYYLNKYRNLHRHSTTSLECTVGFMRRYVYFYLHFLLAVSFIYTVHRFLLSKTNCGGNTGKGETRKKFSHAEAILKWMLRSSTRTIDALRQVRSPDSKHVTLLKDTVASG